MKRIVLLRHGESLWNKENRFTGWTDVDLSEKGVEERRCIALKACTIAFIILVLFTLSGRFLFHFFGISTDVSR